MIFIQADMIRIIFTAVTFYLSLPCSCSVKTETYSLIKLHKISKVIIITTLHLIFSKSQICCEIMSVCQELRKKEEKGKKKSLVS